MNNNTFVLQQVSGFQRHEPLLCENAALSRNRELNTNECAFKTLKVNNGVCKWLLSSCSFLIIVMRTFLSQQEQTLPPKVEKEHAEVILKLFKV